VELARIGANQIDRLHALLEMCPLELAPRLSLKRLLETTDLGGGDDVLVRP